MDRANSKRPSAILYFNLAVLCAAALVCAVFASPKTVAAMTGGAWPVYRTGARGAVSLVCAVNWQASAVEPILDALAAEGVCITFAVSPEWAEENPGLLLRMIKDGHETALMPGAAGASPAAIRNAMDSVELATGARPTTYYCGGPGGRVSAAQCKKLGLDAVYGTVDLDCAGADADLLLKRLASGACEGGIICVQPTASFLTALPDIVNYLKNMGFAIVPTHKMLYN